MAPLPWAYPFRMDEIWVRVGLVAAAFVVAGLIAAWQRRRGRKPVRDVVPVSLDPGTYFFSSETCLTCDRARQKLDQALGERAYVEFAWENEPGVFEDVGVDAVPAVLVVRSSGQGRLYPGQPDRMLAEL